MNPLKSAAVAARGEYDRPWRRIAATLRDEIRTGTLRPGQRLPTVAELQERFEGRSKNTVRGSLGMLLGEGLLTRRGRSYYVSEDAYMPDVATAPEPQPVVAAIVTSHLGVLAGRRNDGKPPWTFIAGEIEPGESQVDAAVREVKEETGLEVRAGYQEIGRRVHPKTGRTMIYLACSPVDGLGVFVGDEEELAEVRWLSLAEVDTLMPGVFEPVRDHLARVIS